MGRAQSGTVPGDRWRWRSLIAVLLLTIAVGVAACGDGDDGDESAAGDTAARDSKIDATGIQKGLTIGFASPLLADNPDQAAYLDGQERAAAQLGWNVEVLDAKLSTDQQVEDIDTFIAQRVDGITSFPLDPNAVEAAFERATQGSIPVAAFNTEAPSVTTRINQLLFTTCEGSKDAASLIAELKPEAKTLVVGPPPVPPLQFRTECFEKAATAEGLEILDRADNTDAVAASAQPIAEELLTKHPDVEAIWAYDDITGIGVAAALEGAGKSVVSEQGGDGIVNVTGCCGNQQGADAVQNGRISAIYDSMSTEAGVAAIKAFAQAYVENGTIDAMPATIEIPFQRYGFDNIDDYAPYEERDVAQIWEGIDLP